MILSQHLAIEQKQTLIMTPRLQQAIQLLQFSTLELNQYIQEELKSNPILEVEIDEPMEEELELDEADFLEDYLAYIDYSFELKQSLERDPEEYNYENYITIKPTLTEYLLSQFNLLIHDPVELEIGEYLIGSLDERGFLSIPIEAVSEALGVEVPRVMAVLKKIQTLDPIGVGARNLVESLIIQCRYLYGDLPLVEQIIKDFLYDLGENRIKQIANKLKVSPTEVQKAADLIKTLNPRPAANFSTNYTTGYLEPDVFIQKVGNDYIVVMNEQTQPHLKINSYYQKILKNSKSDKNVREFLTKKLNSALWLIKCIEQRRMTIYRIVETLVELQRPFLDYGIKYLQPMTLNEVAERIQVHESTVSRATANKYVQTPHGIFELKFFFNSGISGGNGDGLASVSVKEIIQELIQGEDPTKPLSDRKIAELIKERGYSISRRTVAKYRDELGIPPSNKRRRYD
ncbi:RNA polymerase sigma-54 factor [Anoxybacter fermentans]|uniref:RNA polymerase sigma-54 factor n=1 Tax=Anoxybacter fermentans TaxID=1323375 RepID=A0A3Q9HP69_9FIRM|nr:RNA polymerase factor sigma-54 [Anoxybacter fermentans]AZR72275.1 RNA polymerase sigma-54 factor [Anoxybacter fermentans]